MAAILALTGLPAGSPGQEAGSGEAPVGREAALALDLPRLDFRPPEGVRLTVQGIPVLFLERHDLPLVDVLVRFRGGYGLLPRERYAAATALPALLRSGGTASLPPDSVDELVDFHALQVTFGSAGGSTTSSLNAVRSELDAGLALWMEMLRRPRFAPEQVEIWRGQELERIRRRADEPGSMAFSEFNALLFGDHPVGWTMAPGDLAPEKLTPRVLREVHRAVFCRENMILGVAGDLTREELEPRLDRALRDWPSCPGVLEEPPAPDIREGPAVYLMPREIPQSVVLMAHRSEVTLEHPDYLASRIANQILGGGGFQSRLVERVRTEKGWAYGASSFWTAPTDHPGVVGALTRTAAPTTVAAARLLMEVVESLRTAPPGEEEVRTAVEGTVNGFVFNFDSPARVVSRQMFYLAESMPGDWLQRYVRGVQEVGPEDVHRVAREHLRPDEMVVLVVGDPEAFDEPLETLGPVTVLEVEGADVRDGEPGPRPGPTSSPRGGPRFRR